MTLPLLRIIVETMIEMGEISRWHVAGRLKGASASH
jgi:hypothetical protein